MLTKVVAREQDLEAAVKKGGRRLQTQTKRDRYYYSELLFLLVLLALIIDFCSGWWNFAQANGNGPMKAAGKDVPDQVLMMKYIASTSAASKENRFVLKIICSIFLL